MKKTAAIVVSMLAVLVLAVTALAGCGSSGTPDSIAGTTWKVTTMTANGVEINVDDYLKMAGVSGEFVFEFTDTTVSAKAGGQTMGSATTYTYKDGTVTIDGVSAKIENNKMTFDAGTYVFNLEKK